MTYIAPAYQEEGYTGKLYLGEPACIKSRSRMYGLNL